MKRIVTVTLEQVRRITVRQTRGPDAATVAVVQQPSPHSDPKPKGEILKKKLLAALVFLAFTTLPALPQGPPFAAGLQKATTGSPRHPAGFVWTFTVLQDLDLDGATADELHDYVRTAVSHWRMPLAISVVAASASTRFVDEMLVSAAAGRPRPSSWSRFAKQIPWVPVTANVKVGELPVRVHPTRT